MCLFYCDGVCVVFARSFLFFLLFVVVVCLALGLRTAALTSAHSMLVLLCVVCSFVFGFVFVCHGLCFDVVFVL